MRRISLERLSDALTELPENPRLVVSGNAATPWILLQAFDQQVSHYRLHLLNAQEGIPNRDGVIHETVFLSELECAIVPDWIMSLTDSR